MMIQWRFPFFIWVLGWGEGEGFVPLINQQRQPSVQASGTLKIQVPRSRIRQKAIVRGTDLAMFYTRVVASTWLRNQLLNDTLGFDKLRLEKLLHQLHHEFDISGKSFIFAFSVFSLLSRASVVCFMLHTG